MHEFAVQHLLNTPSVAIRSVNCLGNCKQQSAEESVAAAHLVFPYRGVYVRHLGRDNAVAEANQVLFLLNPAESYRVSHPVVGGDASLDLVLDESLLRELAPRSLARDGSALAFRRQRLRVDPRAQALVGRTSSQPFTEGHRNARSGKLCLDARAAGARASDVARAGGQLRTAAFG